jgi:FkbM family methyltransferase
MDRVPIESLKYYSQHGEDQLLWEFFDFKENGCYIDIGAFDGLYLSNTYSFYLAGWRGICVEPHPNFYATLCEYRSEDVCINAACTDVDDGSIEFLSEEFGLYSTILDDPDIRANVESRYLSKGRTFPGFTRINVGTVTLEKLQKQLIGNKGTIDFISIDVEGAEEIVLSGAAVDVFPRLLIVEANDDASFQPVKTMLTVDAGYILARRLGVNYFFTRTSEDAMRLR